MTSAEIVYLPATVLGTRGGLPNGGRYAASARALAELLSEPSVQVVDTTREVARRYGELFAVLRAAGTPIPVNDFWIAAALATGARLITFDTDFARVPGLPHVLMQA